MTTKIRTAVELLAATALPTTYGAWVTAEFPTTGVERLKLLVTLSGSFDGTSVQLKGQVVEGGATFDELKAADGALDEATAVIAADGTFAIEYDVTSFDRVRFLAKRSGGSQGDAALSVLGG